MAQERVQKILAKAGIASRRKAEELILEGQVTINGKLAQLGDKAELGRDAIKVKGKLLQGAEEKIYLAFHKPKGVISMLADPEGRPTLADYLAKVSSRIFPVGRLDFNSEGLILLTNDGALAEKLQRRDDIPRVYRVKVRGHASPEMLERLKSGMMISGHRHVAPHSVRLAEVYQNKSSIEIVMMGAGAIDVKAMVEKKGFLVERMVRTSFGHLTLHGLPPGSYRVLKESQIQALLEQPELAMRQIEKAAQEEAVEVRPIHGRRKGREERREAAGQGGEAGAGPREERPRRFERDEKRQGDRGRGPERDERGPRFGRDDQRQGGWGRGPRRDESGPRFGRDEQRRGGWARGPRRDEQRGDEKPQFGGKPGFGQKPRGASFGGDSPRGAGFGAGGGKPRFGGGKSRGPSFGGTGKAPSGKDRAGGGRKPIRVVRRPPDSES